MISLSLVPIRLSLETFPLVLLALLAAPLAAQPAVSGALADTTEGVSAVRTPEPASRPDEGTERQPGDVQPPADDASAAVRRAARTPFGTLAERLLADRDTTGPAQPTIPETPTRLQVGGYARFYFQYRRQIDTFPGYDGPARNGAFFIVGGFSRDPTLYLSVGGSPAPNTYFRTEYLLFSPLTGDPGGDETIQDTTGAVASPNVNLYQTLNITGSVQTDVGRFDVVAGGLSWYRVTPMTLWGFEPSTYRIFDREPWTPPGTGADRYLGYYNAGAISRDQRFGRQPVAGFIVEGSQLPGGFQALAVYGKSNFSGGQGDIGRQYARNLAIGRVSRARRGATLGVNAFAQFGDTGLTGQPGTSFRPEGQQILTADARVSLGRIAGYVEAGAGRYYSPTYESLWTPTVLAEVSAPRGAEIRLPAGGDRELVLDFKVPLALQGYHIGESVVNFNGLFFNTAVQEAGARYGDVQIEGATLSSGVSEVGQMANNRQGVSARSEVQIGALKISGGLEVERDLVAIRDLRGNEGLPEGAIQSSLTFPHPMASEVRSEFAQFAVGAGPYGRLLNFFRYTLEEIPLIGPERLDRKGYNNAELQLKHKFDLFGRPFIQTYTGVYHSVTPGTRALPSLSSDAFLRASYQEVGLYYLLHPRLSLIGVAGLERNLSSQRSAPLVNPEAQPGDADFQLRAPIDQTGRVIGVGLDYDFGNRIGLYTRVRRFAQSDPTFDRDYFDGWQATVELKAFF